MRVAEAVSSVTSDFSDAETMLKIARYEGGFSQEVANCKTVSSHGAVGAWQIIPTTRSERVAVCEDIVYAAANALMKVQGSREACHWNHKQRGAWELDVYVSGKCDKGRSYSIARWGDGSSLYAIYSELIQETYELAQD